MKPFCLLFIHVLTTRKGDIFKMLLYFNLQEAQALVARAFQHTVKVLQDNKDKLHSVSDYW